MEVVALTLPLPDPAFWSGQRILLTGHTGFKGSWTAMWLERLGATVHGVALAPEQTPDLYSRLAPFAGLHSSIADIGDIADAARLKAIATDFAPTLVLHMAAQALVRRSYAEPAATFATNVVGTANVLDAVRDCPTLRAALIVTTDKVYANDGKGRRFVEDDRLGGEDPYSASKAAAELVASSYAHSFFTRSGVVVATARAGNVVGGGDWSADRIVPDIWRALHAGRPLELRYPNATRPWQHVLDPVAGYLLYLEALARGAQVPPALNFGPAAGDDAITVAEVAELVARHFEVTQPWRPAPSQQPPEMTALALDASAAQDSLGWQPRLDARRALQWTADWYRRFDAGEDVRETTLGQIAAYEALT